MRAPRPPAGAGEAGFVLPAVLVILLVLSAAAATVALRLQTRTTLAGQRADGLRLQGLADGITRLVAFGLVVERSHRAQRLGLPEDGGPVLCPLPEGLSAWIALRDQGGLLDLNTTPRPQMEEDLRALGVPDRDAATLAAEIVDFRDPDETPEPGGGAEAPQYRARGLPNGPRNGPFLRADEIARLPSMTPAFAALLLPSVTVFNLGGRLDTSRLRRVATAEAARQPPRPSQRQFLRVEVLVAGAAGARAGRSALVSTADAPVGIGIVEWVRSIPSGQAGSPHPACARIAAAIGPDR